MKPLIKIAMRLPTVTLLLESIQQQIDSDLPFNSELAVQLLNLVFYDFLNRDLKEQFDELVSYSLDKEILEEMVPLAIDEIEEQICINGVYITHLDNVKILNDDGDFVVYLHSNNSRVK